MADKTDAINEAKDAALNSVGFTLIGTKAQSDALKKSSLVAARNVVAVRKTVTEIVQKFKVYENAVSQIKSIVKKGGPDALASIAIILSAGGNAYKQKEAEQEQKPSALSLIKGGADKVAASAGAIGALALAIPFLLSPEVREMLMSFFDGFLQGLGLGKDALGKVKTGLIIAAGVLGAYFSAKVLMSVVDAFRQMQKLAQVMGLAGEAVATQKSEIDLEKNKVKKAGDAAKDDIKSSKKDLKKGRKMSILKKPGFLLEKISPKLISLVKNFVKALPLVGTVLGIGLVLYDLFDIGKDIYDFFTSSDDKEEEQGAERESAPAAAASTAPAEAPAAAAEEKPTAGGTPPSPTSETTPGGGSLSAPAEATAEASTASASSIGSLIKTASVSVERADVDLAKTAGGVNIVTVDNSTTVIGAGKQTLQQHGAPIFSVSVGMC